MARCLFVGQKGSCPPGELKTRNSFFMGEARKLTGRPPMTEGKRTKKIAARFTQSEFEQIVALEKQLGISETELVRRRLLDDSARNIVNAREFLSTLDHLGAEMARIGNNVNQLARHANKLQLMGSLHPSIVIQFNALFEEDLSSRQELDATLRKVIREMVK